MTNATQYFIEGDNLVHISLAAILAKTMMEEAYQPDECILHHAVGNDLMPGNIITYPPKE